MYQVNYKGLRRRESYDEVVSIIENDQAKIKYPNRVAVQILNSPYMKQLDTEALMDMQNQQDRMSKNKMKQLVMQELASQTGTPFVQMRAQHDPARQAGVMSQLKSDSDYQEALDDRASEFRTEVGEMLNAQTQTEMGKKFEMANLVSQHLSDQVQRYHPVADDMVAEREIQAVADTDMKATQTGLLREEEELRRMADENRKLELALKEKGTREHKMQEIYNKLEEKMRQAEQLSLERPERKAAIGSIASSIQAVAGGGKMSPEEAQEMLRRLRMLYEKGGGYGGSSSSSAVLGSLASLFNIFTPQATPRFPSARKRPAPEAEIYAQRPKSEPGGSSKSFSVSSAVAIPVKNEPVKAESVKSEMKSRTATNSGNVSQRYPLFAEGVKKKSESVKSSKSSAGSASQRSGMMALPVGNEPYEGPSLGGSSTSSVRRRREAIKTPSALRSPSGSQASFQIGSVEAGSMTSSRGPSVVSVQSSRRSGRSGR
jgi:hypothetical protein